MVRVEEPLQESAPLAWVHAGGHCHVDPATGVSCAPYHRIWQYLRLMDLVTTPVRNADFYAEAIGAAASRSARPRILISGTADYCMLAHVLAACRARGVTPDTTVRDVCETPLMLNQWYARRAGLAIRTIAGDILHQEDDRAFDIICTDSLLSRFPPAQRRQLVAKWRRLLEPGGLVITVNRVRQLASGDSFRYSASQVEDLRASVLERAAQSVRKLDRGPEELALAAVEYARLREVHPFSSLHEVQALFTQAGYELDQVSAPITPAGPQPWSAEPRGVLYARIVARSP